MPNKKFSQTRRKENTWHIYIHYTYRCPETKIPILILYYAIQAYRSGHVNYIILVWVYIRPPQMCMYNQIRPFLSCARQMWKYCYLYLVHIIYTYIIKLFVFTAGCRYIIIYTCKAKRHRERLARDFQPRPGNRQKVAGSVFYSPVCIQNKYRYA